MTRIRAIRYYALVVITALLSSNLNGQCGPFNCNDTINVSVNFECMAIITPNLLLEGFTAANPGCTYNIVLRDQNGNLIPPVNGEAKLSKNYIGQFVKAEISDQSNPNRKCWSIIRVEDKLPPGIFCPGNDTLFCHLDDIGANETQLRAFLKNKVESKLLSNCGNEKVEIVITGNDLTRNCVGEFAARRIVKFIVVDKIQNQTACIDTIYYRSISVDSLTAPKNFVDGAALKCYQNPKTDVKSLNAYPTYKNQAIIKDYVDSIFSYRGLCNFKITYSDTRFNSCGGSYKIVRTWTIIDWCIANKVKVFHQVIKVVDDQIIVTCPLNISNQVADPLSCKKTIVMPVPVVLSDCSNWSYTIFIKEPGAAEFIQYGSTRPGGSSPLSRPFMLGTTMVKYLVEDDCDNSKECMYNVTVVDEEPPVAVCDLRTVVTLNDNYIAKIFAKTFDNDNGDGKGPTDDGSYDYCSGPVSFRVRRVDGAKCGSSGVFDDFVKFCCEDLGKVIMVELEVTDKVGLSSYCMAEVVVQFKGVGPEFECIRDPLMQDCRNFENYNLNSLRPFSLPYANPCFLEPIIPKADTIVREIDECGNGRIVIDWYVDYSGVKEVVCRNTILFSPINPFGYNDINWPADRIASGCDDLPPTSSEIENLLPDNIPCSKIVYSEPEDQIFQNVPGFCRKILRTWTVVDWCRYPADPSARWSYIQAIVVKNSEAPVFAVPPAQIQIQEEQNNCRAFVTANAEASDDCSPASKLTWSYSVDRLTDIGYVSLIASTPGKSLSRYFDFGNYRINWIVKDECGNSSSSSSLLELKDKQAPTVSCKNISVEIDEGSRKVIISPNNLLLNSSDNCDTQLEYFLSMSGSEVLSASLEFDCEQIGLKQIDLWAVDHEGNRSKCTAIVNVKDTEKICIIGSGAFVGGFVKTVQQDAVETAEVSLYNPDMDEKKYTSVEGRYAFEDIAMYKNYAIRVDKSKDYLNGVSTLDIILIQRHILGLQKFTDPYKLLAADVNESHNVSASDIVLLRKLILGQITELPSSMSWKFLPASYNFSDPENPWNYDEKIELSRLSEDFTANNFIGIKIGDLDGNAKANSAVSKKRNSSSYSFRIKESREGSKRILSFYPSGYIKLAGFQMSLDLSKWSGTGPIWRSGQIELEPSMTYVAGNMAYISYHNPGFYSITSSDALFSLELSDFGSNANEILTEEHYQREFFNDEIYDAELTSFELILDFVENGAEELVVYQNNPNPFDDYTRVEFEISSTQQISFNLFDLNGKTIHTIERQFERGKNQIVIGKNELGLNKGIYYYQISSQNRSLTKKMIIF